MIRWGHDGCRVRTRYRDDAVDRGAVGTNIVVVERPSTSSPLPPAPVLATIAWTLTAATWITQNIVRDLSAGRPIHWRHDVYEETVYWIAFAALTPLLARLAQRFSFIENRRRAFAGHFVAAPMVATLQVSLYFGIMTAISQVIGAAPATTRALFVAFAMTAYWKYWVIVALLHGIAYARLYSNEQRAAAELRAQLSDAELERLRAQLQPHFLFNTLNSIAVLLRDQPERARTMVLRLSELLRTVVYANSDQFVPLSREIAFIRQYLDIQQIRFGPRLDVEWLVDADAERELVPQFLIQPLVENAVQHGISTTESGGTVSIRAQRSNGELHIAVTDNPASAVERLTNGAGAGAEPGGVGLTNTRERLAKLYGGAAGLRMETTERGGMRVDVRIPARAHGE